MTIAWAMISCDKCKRTPAACINCAPAHRMEASKSAGTPSIDEDDAESCSAVARALDKWVRPELEGAMRGRKVDDDDKDMMRKTLR